MKVYEVEFLDTSLEVPRWKRDMFCTNKKDALLAADFWVQRKLNSRVATHTVQPAASCRDNYSSYSYFYATS